MPNWKPEIQAGLDRLYAERAEVQARIKSLRRELANAESGLRKRAWMVRHFPDYEALIDESRGVCQSLYGQLLDAEIRKRTIGGDIQTLFATPVERPYRPRARKVSRKGKLILTPMQP